MPQIGQIFQKGYDRPYLMVTSPSVISMFLETSRRVRPACVRQITRRATSNSKPILSLDVGSLRPRSDDQVQALRFNERPKIPVPGKERDPAINATLGDQSISEARFALSCEPM